MSQNKFFPGKNLLGDYHELDGTIEFYGRINAMLKKTDYVLDLGAGRGSWYSADRSSYRRDIRDLKNKVKYLVGVDIDSAVLENPTTHENLIMINKKIPLESKTIDVIVADWVLEHVEDPKEFYLEIDRVLKPGGIFCARTPHKYKYVSFFAKLFKNLNYIKVLKFLQPERLEQDAFPITNKVNTIKCIKKYFFEYKDFSYLYTSHPSYYAGNKYLFELINFFHKILPKIFVSEIFVFLKKNKINNKIT